MSTEVYYFDENGRKVTDEKLAKRVMIRELDENGNLVNETFGDFVSNEEDEILEFTQEEIDEAIAEGYELDFSKIRIVDGKGAKL